MNLTPITTIVRTVIAGVVHNSPIILTGLSVAGVIGTVGMAIEATPKASRILRQENFRREEEEVRDNNLVYKPITKKEALKLVWKCYIPTAAMGLLTVACIVGANKISLRRNAALASVYSLTESALKEYQAKVVETIGENKELKIRDSIAQDHLDAKPLSTQQVIITGGGDQLCFDTLSGRYFKSDIEKIRKVENKLNRELMVNMYVSLNELYYDLGLPNIDLGDDEGWDVDHMINFTFSSKIAENDQPCLVINYLVGPRAGYNKVY